MHVCICINIYIYIYIYIYRERERESDVIMYVVSSKDMLTQKMADLEKSIKELTENIEAEPIR